MRTFLVLLAAVYLSGCSVTVPDPVAVPEPRKIDCDLIFPGPVDTTR